VIQKIKTLIENIKLLVIKPSKTFKKPKKKDIIIYDRDGSENFIPYFKNYSYQILDTRGESLNIYILLKAFLKKRFSFMGYVITYLEEASPKIVITFIDDKFSFYKIKSLYPSTTTIFVQNGYRDCSTFDSIELQRKNFPNLEVDYMFVFNKHVGEKYSKYIKGMTIPIGSFKCNEYYKEKEISTLDEKTILFISQYRYHTNPLDIMHEDIIFKDFYMPETILLPMLQKYCIENSFNLVISAHGYNENTDEYDFYENILGKDDWSIQYKTEKCSSYNALQNVYGVVFIDSTLGYESLAINKRTCAFSARESYINRIGYRFGWSEGLGKKGKFWTDEILQEEFDRVTKFVFESPENIWDETLSKMKDDLMEFDKGNVKFTSIIENVLKEDIS